MPEKKIYKVLIFLIGISAIVRAFLAWALELGNDEVYYWTYALYSDLSHFDHPPMVGFVIQLFSLDLLLDDELFVRFSSVILGSVNTWIIFLIGKKIKDSLTGLYAAFLYTSSIYCFVIAGIFILPDTPQLFFWLLSLYFITGSLLDREYNTKSKLNLVLTGLFLGLGMLSKYTTVFLWFGIISYILIYDRKWLRTKSLYLSAFLTLAVFSPVIWWNIQNNFISITFQGGRVDVLGSRLRFDYFLLEIIGEFLYNNPVNVIIIILSLFGVYKKRIFLAKPDLRFLLFSSLPLIIIFIVFSLFRRTLPHWTAPGYTTLLLIAAAFLREKSLRKKSQKLIPHEIKTAIYLLSFILIIGFIQVNFGIINFYDPQKTNPAELGEKDVSLDIFGWRQIGDGFSEILKKDIKENKIGKEPAIITYRWFPAANLDYYAARQNFIKVLAIGPLYQIHKYYWINQKRGGFRLGMDAYYITTSRDFMHPDSVYSHYFESIETVDTIKIMRGNTHVMNAFVYRMKDLKILPKCSIN
ncbi:MAG: glycosyltransferase family 39 protein [Bacteroidetes bacterium]|nr:glycosyltransferase family 39 protein [Bacteroidota bacterium]MBL7103558.1 glycosyltransferase family 39 protein [Bacteroidales bacterium]